MVEEDGSHIVQVAVQREQTSPRLVRPDFDLVIIASRHEQRLRLVEVNASNRAVVLLKAVYERAHAVIPQLDRRRVQ